MLPAFKKFKDSILGDGFGTTAMSVGPVPKMPMHPPMRSSIREHLKYPIVRAGWTVGLDWRSRYVPSTLTGLVLALKQLGWEPSTCVDVGAAWGTVELQRGFRRSRHVLIEPNPMFAAYLQERSQRRGWTLHQVAVSDGPGELAFLVQHSHQGGRVIRDGEDVSAYGQTITVPALSLDEIDRRFPFGSNLLLKIDVEGHEGPVLRGATSVLERTEVLVVETRPLVPSGHSSSSQIVAMALEADLHLVGFLTAWSEGPHRRLTEMVDLVFARPGGPVLSRRLP
jgi:FkbM family methyltransferase